MGEGGVDFHHGSHSDDAIVMHFQLEIATRKKQAPIESKTKNTHKFRQITTMHLLKRFYVQLIKFILEIKMQSPVHQ